MTSTLISRAVFLVVAVSAWEESLPADWSLQEAGSSFSQNDLANRVLLTEAAKQGAVCLDGSPAAYYIRKGVGSGERKWYIHHQGGGWCENLDDCLGRSKTDLGSSLRYDSTQAIGGGYFSTDPSVNPMMYNWNAVYLRYCDGGSFSGLNATTTEYKGAVLHFRGKAILHAMQQDLLNKGLAESTDVVISGCSAGGLATYLHVDYWAAILKAPGRKVVGMPDSGFFLDYEGSPHYHSGMSWVFQQMNSTTGVNQACVSAHTASNDTWKCIFAEHTAPHIETPIFPLQGAYDSWQISNDLGSQDPVEVNAYGSRLSKLVEKNLLASNSKHGIFLDSCFHHCGGWGAYYVNGKNQAVAFQQWYEKGSMSLPNKGYYTQGKSYPCKDCCHKPIADAIMV